MKGDGITEDTAPIGTDQDAGDGPLQKSLIGNHWDKERIRVYGWADMAYTESSSNHNDFPNTYAVMPNRPVLDQFILRVEQTPDTVQTDHNDWGFRVTNLYGTDYRFTAGTATSSTSFKSEMRCTAGTPSRCTSMSISPRSAEKEPCLRSAAIYRHATSRHSFLPKTTFTATA